MDRPRSRPQRLSEYEGALEERSATNTLLVGLDSRGAIVLRERVSRGRITSRLANVTPCLIGIKAGLATHYVARAAHLCKALRQEHKNDFRDAHAVAEAVQRPTTRFVPAKTDEQLDLQALHRVRSRLVNEPTAVINQIRGFLRHSVEAGEPGRSTASRFGSLAPLSACILPCWLQHSPTCKRSSSPREWLTAQANPESKSWLSAEVCSRKEEMERRSRQRVSDRNPYGLWGRDANEIERARYPCWPGAQMLHQ